MTTQYCVLNSASGQAPDELTLRQELFAIDGNTVLYTSDATAGVSERTNAKTQYVGSFVGVTVIPAGDYFAVMSVISTGRIVATGERTFTGTNGETATQRPAALNAGGREAIAEAVDELLSDSHGAESWAAGLSAGQQLQLNSIEAKTNLITSSTRITIAANSGSSITLKCGDDYAGSTAKRIEITDADSSLYDLLRTETLQARAFGAGIRRDAVIGTFSRDTITHTAASGSIPAYTTIFVECSVASDTPAGVTTYDIQITDASGRKHTPFSGQVTLVQDFKS